MADDIFFNANPCSLAMKQQIAEADIRQPLHADGAYTSNIQEVVYKMKK